MLASIVVGVWLVYTPGGLLGKADAIGYAVCHRIDLRSFHLGARALPLCARCSGMYLSAILTLSYFQYYRPRSGLFPGRNLRVVLVLFGVIWAVDGFNSYLHFFPNAPHLYPPNNTLRLITGSMVGISLATLVYPSFNQFAWQRWKPVPVLESMGDLVKLLGLTTVMVVAVLTENSLILYPLTVLSSLAVLVLLTAVYTTVVLAFIRKENMTASWRDLLLPLLGGLTLAFVQIGLFDLGRYLLTGTWDGFSF